MEMGTALEKVFTEINVWGRINSPNVVRLYELMEVNDHDYLYLVIEFCDLGQIGDWVNQDRLYKRSQKVYDYVLNEFFKDREFKDDNEKVELVAKHIFKDAITGLEYLHNKNFVHRDIKLDNILMASHDSKAKLADFSVSCELDEDQTLMNSEGTAAFMAPEMQNTADGFLAKPTDIWSMGITLYTYINEKPPFWDDNEYCIQTKAETEELLKLENVSDELNDLLSKMLAKDPNDRPTVAQVLEHEWFKNE